MKLEIDSAYFMPKGRDVLSGAYLSVSTGELVGLLGRNGTGKSTLLKMIFGMPGYRRFNLRLDGKPIQRLYDRGLVQYQSQQPFLPDSSTISQAVAQFIGDKSALTRITNRIEELPDKRLKSLSLGKRRMLESLILLNTNAPFLLMDEPFSGLSPLMIEALEEEILKASQVKGIVITDHWYQVVMRIAQQLKLIHGGSLFSVNDEEDLQRLGYISA